MERFTSLMAYPVTTESEALRVSRFLLSEYSFDDQRFTPGEEDHFRLNPFQSLQLAHQQFWYAENEDGEVIGACSVIENEQRTGGYMWDYIAVHKYYRKLGIANHLYNALLEYVESHKGRYIIAFTCDLPEYSSVQHMFHERGFHQIGYCPDYYYEGEGRFTFLKKLGTKSL